MVQVGDQVIQSPGTVTLKRKDNYTVHVSEEGYYDNYARLRAAENPWLLGNILWDLPTTALFLTITQGMAGFHVVGPGSIYDRATGAGYELVPGELKVTLQRRSASEPSAESTPPALSLHPRIVKEISLPSRAWAVTSEAGCLWVVHGKDVSRIDPLTNNVVETLPKPAGALYFTEPDSLWFVRHEFLGAPSLCKMDRRTQQVTASVSLPRSVGMVRFGEGAFWALVVPRGLGCEHKPLEILKIDPQSATIVGRICLSETNWPVSKGPVLRATTLTAGLGSIWVTRGSVLVRVDAESNAVVATIPLDYEPSWAEVGEGALYVFSCRKCYEDQTAPERVARIDAATNAVGRSIPYPGKPNALAVGLGAIWLINGEERTQTLQWIDSQTGAVSKNPLPLGENLLYGFANSPYIAVHQGDLWVVKGNSLLRIAPD
jgi:hypothetical protein